MRIVEQGIKQSERLMTGRCRTCQTKVECSAAEATWLADGPTDTGCHGILCPTCNDSTTHIYLRPVRFTTDGRRLPEGGSATAPPPR